MNVAKRRLFLKAAVIVAGAATPGSDCCQFPVCMPSDREERCDKLTKGRRCRTQVRPDLIGIDIQA